MGGAPVQTAVQKPTLNIGGSIISLDDMEGEEENLYSRDLQYPQTQEMTEEGVYEFSNMQSNNFNQEKLFEFIAIDSEF